MPQPALFTPFKIRNLELDNRIVIAPMCQYSADNGLMNDWHLMHLGQLAQSGAGLLTIEATAVEPQGRITHADVGLWDDATETAMGDTIERLARWSSMPIALQLSHAGRKASSRIPWLGRGGVPVESPNGWQTEAPSALAFYPEMATPNAFDRDGLKRVRDAFAAAAGRADRIGIDAIQIHAAHGYLLHQFLSPLANQRTDEYGGSAENRARFPLEVFEAVRAAYSPDRPVSVRISATDWVEGGFDLEQAIAFSQALVARGCDVIHVSSGGLHPDQQMAVHPGYQVPLARSIKAAVKVPVVAVGLITDPTHAEAIIANGDADLIGIARTVLYDPRWPWHAAAELGGRVQAANQYLGCQPAQLRELFRSPEN